MYDFIKDLEDDSINRNIVECKEIYYAYDISYIVVLIETLWNVKSSNPPVYLYKGVGINRNIVECKGRFPGNQKGKNAVLIETLWNVKIIPALLAVIVSVY